MQAQSFIDRHLDDDIIILNGDGPLIDAETINKAFDYHKNNDNSITLISAIVDDTNGIGHIQRDENGKLLRIIEHKDANDEEKKINESNAGFIGSTAVTYHTHSAKSPTTTLKTNTILQTALKFLSRQAKM